MSLELLIVPQLMLLAWFFLNRKAATEMALEHSSEDAMLQHLRDYLHKGYEVPSRAALLQLTEKASAGAFQCKRQSFFQPRRDGLWSLGQSPLNPEQSGLLAAIAAQGEPIDRRVPNSMVGPDLLRDAHTLMDHYGINVLVPVSDSMEAQWVWASYFAERQHTPGNEALRSWQMAMQSVVERGTLRLASAHLAELEKDAASATQVLRVLLPEAPSEAREGLEWVGSLRRASGEAPVLFAAYPQGPGKVLVVFAEITAPGLAAVILASALRGFCDSLIAACKESVPLRPERVLAKLNRYVWHPEHPNDLSCVVALFDTNAQRVDYASAGDPRWLHVKASGEIAPIQGTGPGLGVADEIDYLPQKLDFARGDTCLLVGSDLGADAFDDSLLVQKCQASRYVSAEEMGQHVDTLADVLDQLGGGRGRTPAVVLLRQWVD